MSDHISRERMHEALDGALSSSERALIESHLATCDVCRNELARLSEVVADLRALPRSATPPDDLWSGIRARVRAAGQEAAGEGATVLELPARAAADVAARERSAVRGVRLTVVQLAAAAAAVALITAGTMKLAMDAGAPSSLEVAIEDAAAPGGAAARAVSFEEGRYVDMIDELEQILVEGRTVLAPETLVTIEASLSTVDAAIDEIETALTQDPASDLLLRLLTTHRNTKLGVLQRAAGAIQTEI